MTPRLSMLRWGLLGCLPWVSVAAPPCTLDRAVGTTMNAAPFVTGGYGMRWNARAGLLYTKPDARGYYRIVRQPVDAGSGGDAAGTPIAAIGDAAGVPTKHLGAAYWHPSGRFFLFVAQKPEWSGRTLFGVPDYEALPGFGRHDDLWIATADGRRAWRLTQDAGTKDEGVLIPVFAPDGVHVAWSSRQPGGKYVIEIAEFVESPEPHLSNPRSYRPGEGSYYEPGSFSSDSQSLLYASDADTHSFWRSQIYRLDVRTGRGTRLTEGNDYNEHPTVVGTPSGDRIVYMSTQGVNRFRGNLFPGTDWYAMTLEGGQRKRLTQMNLNRSDNPQNEHVMQVAGTVAVSPTGDYMLGDVQNSLIKQTGSVKLIRFVCAP